MSNSAVKGSVTLQQPCTSSEPLISLAPVVTHMYCFQGQGPLFCCFFYCFLSQSCEAFRDVHTASYHQAMYCNIDCKGLGQMYTCAVSSNVPKMYCETGFKRGCYTATSTMQSQILLLAMIVATTKMQEMFVVRYVTCTQFFMNLCFNKIARHFA